MINVDAIIVGPDNLDYPIWRWMMKESREAFNEVFYVCHKAHRNVSYHSFLQKEYADINYELVDIPSEQDWRSYCVNKALDKSTSEYVLFLEQDFLPRCADFWERILNQGVEVVGFNYSNPTFWDEDIRLHPGFLLVKRELIDRTNRDFGISKKFDHFTLFCNELLKLKPTFLSLETIGLQQPADWYHWNGLSHNMSNVQEGKEPHYYQDVFDSYINMSLNAPTPRDPQFDRIFTKYIRTREDG